MEETWEDIIGDEKPMAKDLFKLIAREGRITAEDATQLIGADRQSVDSWIKLLVEKKYVFAEGPPANPTLRPSDEIIAKIEERACFLGQRVGVRVPTAAADVEKERHVRMKLEEELRDKEHIIDGLQAELLQEKKENAYLEEKVRLLNMKLQGGTGVDVGELEMQLERERAERIKLEELLRKKQEELDRLRPPKEEKPKEAEAEKPQTVAQEEKKPAKLRRWTQVMKTEEKASEPVKKEAEEKVEPEVHATYAKEKEETDATDLIRLLASKGAMKDKDAQAELKVDEKTLREWVGDLSQKGVVELKRHLFGCADIALKKGIDVEAVISDLAAQKIREEFRRLREAK